MSRVALVMVGLMILGDVAQAADRPDETREQCWARRQQMIDEAERQTVVADRIAILDKLPDCDPKPAPRSPVMRSGMLAEVAVGLGQPRTSQGPSQVTFAFSCGVGRFLSPRLALEGRVAGLPSSSGGSSFLGFAGPTVHWWAFDRLVISGGAGLGFIASTDATKSTALGYDARIAYAFSRDGRGTQVSTEVTYTAVDFRDVGVIGVTTWLVQVGYAVF